MSVATIPILTRRGILVERGFLDPETCSSIVSAMLEASAGKAFVVDGHRYLVDEKARKATLTSVGAETARTVTDRLNRLRPSLEERFGSALAEECAGPEFLIYREGDFFRPHKDTLRHPALPEEVRRRALSAVVFLNDFSEEPRANCYGGGALRFYHPASDATWDDCRVPFYGERGALVVFRSDTVHEVTSIAHGERYTAVTWFYAKEAPSPHHTSP